MAEKEICEHIKLWVLKVKNFHICDAKVMTLIVEKESWILISPNQRGDW